MAGSEERKTQSLHLRVRRLTRQRIFCGSMILVALALAPAAQAQFTGVPQAPLTLGPRPVSSFLEPNERHPHDARAILQHAPRGVYITVGSERGFLVAGDTPQVEYLLLLDVNPLIVFFNRVNTALLAMSHAAVAHEPAEGRAQAGLRFYRFLRRKASHTFWQRHLPATEPWRSLIQAPATHNLWRTHIRKLAFNGLYAEQPAANRTRFPEVNYLRESAQYARVAALASEGRIEAHVADLTKRDSLEPLFRGLQQRKIPLAVLDISNAANSPLSQDPFLNGGGADLIELTKTLVGDDSLLVATRFTTQRINPLIKLWDYHGWRIRDIQRFGSELFWRHLGDLMDRNPDALEDDLNSFCGWANDIVPP